MWYQIISNKECSKKFAEITDKRICAGSGNSTTTTCFGDSGGPMFCRDSYNRRVQVGIVIGSVGCGIPYTPTVFVRISKFIVWIHENAV